MKKNTEQKKPNSRVFDPVCGIEVTDFLADAQTGSLNGAKFYFCSHDCHDRFKKNSKKYLNQEPLLKVRDLQKTFIEGDSQTKILHGLNFNIWEGDFVAIIGQSGSGKSTCLNMIGLLDRPSAGDIILNGENVAYVTDEKRAKLRSETFGFVFQQYNLIPWLTAYENVSLPLIMGGKKIDVNALKKDFAKIGLEKRMSHHPSKMSGGEKQRVALLRALINDPKIIIGDEPTGNLDSKTGDLILEMLIELNRDQGRTLIIVTHDGDIAKKADQVITIKDGLVVRDHQRNKKIYTQ